MMTDFYTLVMMLKILLVINYKYKIHNKIIIDEIINTFNFNIKQICFCVLFNVCSSVFGVLIVIT